MSLLGFQNLKKGSSAGFRLTGTIKIDSKSVTLPRLGELRLKEIPKVDGRVLSVTVTRKVDRWL